jgi:hypothetical protein
MGHDGRKEGQERRQRRPASIERLDDASWIMISQEDAWKKREGWEGPEGGREGVRKGDTLREFRHSSAGHPDLCSNSAQWSQDDPELRLQILCFRPPSPPARPPFDEDPKKLTVRTDVPIKL